MSLFGRYLSSPPFGALCLLLPPASASDTVKHVFARDAPSIGGPYLKCFLPLRCRRARSPVVLPLMAREGSPGEGVGFSAAPSELPSVTRAGLNGGRGGRAAAGRWSAAVAT